MQAENSFGKLAARGFPASGFPRFRERLFPADDLERSRDERRAALGRGVPFEAELRARRKDGVYR